MLYLADRYLVDGVVNGCGKTAQVVGSGARRMHKGFVPFYGLAMVIGVLFFVVARALWAG